MLINPFCLVTHSYQSNWQMVCLTGGWRGTRKMLLGEWVLLIWNQVPRFFSWYSVSCLMFFPTLVRWAASPSQLLSSTCFTFLSVPTSLFLALKTLPKLLSDESLGVLFHKKSTAWFSLLMTLQPENGKVNRRKQEVLAEWQRHFCLSSITEADVSLEAGYMLCVECSVFAFYYCDLNGITCCMFYIPLWIY